MPIRVPDELPAVNFLRDENVFVMTSSRAKTQEIRPLKVLILNLMPKKIETENQFLRLLSNSPLQIDIQLLRIDSRESKNTPAEHLNNFYCDFEDIQNENFDGLIVTGAPLGLVDFCDVAYWPQIERVIDWAKNHVTSTLFVCWAVQAALNILYGIPKMTREVKLSGVYPHQTLQQHALLTRGFDESFTAPHSRYADFPTEVIRQYTDTDIGRIRAGRRLPVCQQGQAPGVCHRPSGIRYADHGRRVLSRQRSRPRSCRSTQLLPR